MATTTVVTDLDFGEIVTVVGSVHASKPVVQHVVQRLEQTVHDATVSTVGREQSGEGRKAND